jgi:hypothetical protein
MPFDFPMVCSALRVILKSDGTRIDPFSFGGDRSIALNHRVNDVVYRA